MPRSARARTSARRAEKSPASGANSVARRAWRPRARAAERWRRSGPCAGAGVPCWPSSRKREVALERCPGPCRRRRPACAGSSRPRRAACAWASARPCRGSPRRRCPNSRCGPRARGTRRHPRRRRPWPDCAGSWPGCRQPPGPTPRGPGAALESARAARTRSRAASCSVATRASPCWSRWSWVGVKRALSASTSTPVRDDVERP